jgi:hypothetical protein
MGKLEQSLCAGQKKQKDYGGKVMGKTENKNGAGYWLLEEVGDK